jgi:hypothetical protein
MQRFSTSHFGDFPCSTDVINRLASELCTETVYNFVDKPIIARISGMRFNPTRSWWSGVQAANIHRLGDIYGN